MGQRGAAAPLEAGALSILSEVNLSLVGGLGGGLLGGGIAVGGALATEVAAREAVRNGGIVAEGVADGLAISLRRSASATLRLAARMGLLLPSGVVAEREG